MEPANLLVEGRFGEDTSGIFRELQRNSTTFSGDQLEILRPAIELANAQQRNSGDRDRGRNQNRRWNGGQYQNQQRGQRYNSYRGNRQQSDTFNTFNRPVQQSRNERQDQSY